MAHRPEAQLVALDGTATGLAGHLYAPEGEGPFPAVVWCHGSERDPGAQPALGRFYAGAGHVVLVAHRRGHGDSDGTYELDAIPELARTRAAVTGEPAEAAVELVIEHHERRLADTVAAIAWLAGQPSVDATRLAVSGVSFGATQALLAAEAGAPVAACVAFSPSATAWSLSPLLRERLLRAVRDAAVPTLVIQAANDHDMGPSEALGAQLERRGPPSRARVYPAYGTGASDGHGAFACTGMPVWGDDVLAFLREVFAMSQAQ